MAPEDVEIGAAPRDDAPASGRSPVDAALQILDGAWNRMYGATPLGLGAGLLLLLVLRAGLRFDLDGPFFVRAGQSFPDPLPSWRSNSPLNVVVAAATGADSFGRWKVVGVVLVTVALVVMGLVVVRRFPRTDARVGALTWLSLSSVPVVLLQRIGSYDAYTAVGSVLIIFGRTPATALVGGVLVGATSFEQGVLGLVGAAALVVALDAGDGPRPALRRLRVDPLGSALACGLVGITVGRVGVMVWIARSGVPVPGRSDVFAGLLDDSLRNAAGAGLAGIWAWFGAAWLLVVLAWLLGGWARGRTLLVLAALTGPGILASATTLDGTRVFAMVSLPALLVLVTWVVDRPMGSVERRLVNRWTAAAVLAAVLLPAVVTETRGESLFRFPWELLTVG